jgi:transcriptional regulator with XRE-family HTH domain
VESVLPPFWTDAPKRQAPRSPSYAGLMQRAHFVKWLREQREQRGISRKQLARQIWPKAGEATTARIKAYETIGLNEQGRPIHVMLPSPETLRKICAALGIPWPSTFTLAGYYREILHCLAALAELGKRWLHEDGIVTDMPSALNFRSVGVRHFDEYTVWHGLKMARYRQRYIAGTIAQHFRRSIESQIIETSSAQVARGMDRLLQEYADRYDRFSYVVPKPMAVAILVVASGFPRRGDVWKRGVDIYAVRLLEAATPLLEHALKIAKVKLYGNIQRADQVLSDVQLPIDGRRVVAAEHLISWADVICQGYTHYARLASMEYFGVAGSAIDKLTPEYQLPQIRRARLPYVEQFGHMPLN